MARCSAWTRNPPFLCEREAVDGSEHCIAHKERVTAEEERAFAKLVSEMLHAKNYNFAGFVFPKVFEAFADQTLGSDASFRHARFSGNALFRDSKFGGGADFGEAVIKGDANFKHCEIAGDAVFEGATIEGSALFTKARIGGKVLFGNASVKGTASFGSMMAHSVDFSNATVSGYSVFARANIQGDVFFHRTRFQDDISFVDAEVTGEAHFDFAVFGRGATFWNAGFRRLVSYWGCQFHGDAKFWNVRFGGGLNLGQAVFKGPVSFSGAEPPPSGNFEGLIAPRGRGESVYRLAKQVSQRTGQYREAGDWHYMERCDAWHSRMFPRENLVWANPLNWAEYVLGRLAFGYGERPLRVLCACAAGVLVYALFYYLTGAVTLRSGKCAGLSESLLLSVAAFVRYGFKQFQLAPGDFADYVVASEVVIGTALISLFLVVMVKRWGRG